MSPEATKRKPFFYDVTLRDGNQALRKPWDLKKKEVVFNQLLKLGVQGIELGYSGASDMEFKACEHLAQLAPANVEVAGLARAVESEITKVWQAISVAPRPRIHTFIATSPYNMENVLRMKPSQVLRKAAEAVAFCRSIMGGKGTIQFSAEHFGDCYDNLDFVIEVFNAVVEEGATVINLPNTVERYRPGHFTKMVSRVVDALPESITIAVHNHNDLGMATATTVESFFAGAVQLETSLNGLGERAGNTNMSEVACALYNCGVDVPLNMKEIYESSLLIAEWSNIPIPEKAPLIGDDVISHRSGIHQDGTIKTQGKGKGAYRGFDVELIGRKETDRLAFTSQSGKTAIYEMIRGANLPITIEEAAMLQPGLKRMSETQGELQLDQIIQEYNDKIFHAEGPLEFLGLETDSHRESYKFKFVYENKLHTVEGHGTGPVEACYQALSGMGIVFHLLEYRQHAQDAEHKDFAAFAISEIVIKGGKEGQSGTRVIGRGKDMDTVKANVKAMVNGINILLSGVVGV